MSRRTVFTTRTPLPAGISRAAVMATLRAHTAMIDLNPLVRERHAIPPPRHAAPDELHGVWYSVTDHVPFLPAGLASRQVSYTCCFHDVPDGLQTHCYAPCGLEIRARWTVGGSLPGEPTAPAERRLGAPRHGLWLREDMRCNILIGGFVRRTLKKAHARLVGRLQARSLAQEASPDNHASAPSGPSPSPGSGTPERGAGRTRRVGMPGAPARRRARVTDAPRALRGAGRNAARGGGGDREVSWCSSVRQRTRGLQRDGPGVEACSGGTGSTFTGSAQAAGCTYSVP
ncbi:hypothetical protein B2J93_3275 [Marssonina coronariae]|uniref:DUF7053 domain-containing protein n=1 Tax=Diplocarpon coronariae TaxID=2795749 RepID=A0A218ZBP6_9HELO|nr:hypothetical protein B2J93_3275 [Marssonina coronariae]